MVHQGVCIALGMDRGERDTQSNDVAHLEFSADGKFLAATVGNPKAFYRVLIVAEWTTRRLWWCNDNVTLTLRTPGEWLFHHLANWYDGEDGIRLWNIHRTYNGRAIACLFKWQDAGERRF